MTDHARMEELIAAYAIDALDEEAALEANRELLDHVSVCERCRSTFREARETAADLAFAARPEPVPAGMEDLILGRIRREARPTTARTAKRLMRTVVAAALASVVAMAGATAFLAAELSESRNTQDRAAAALTMLADPATTVHSLAGDTGQVTVLGHPSGRALLIGEDLRLPGGKLFEIWLVRGAGVVPAGTFVPEDGRALIDLRFDPARDIGVAITIEDEPVEQPTSTPVFQGSLSA